MDGGAAMRGIGGGDRLGASSNADPLRAVLVSRTRSFAHPPLQPPWHLPDERHGPRPARYARELFTAHGAGRCIRSPAVCLSHLFRFLRSCSFVLFAWPSTVSAPSESECRGGRRAGEVCRPCLPALPPQRGGRNRNWHASFPLASPFMVLALFASQPRDVCEGPPQSSLGAPALSSRLSLVASRPTPFVTLAPVPASQPGERHRAASLPFWSIPHHRGAAVPASF